MSNVQDIDLGLQEIYADLEELASYEIKVGIQAGEKRTDGADMAEIAAYNEYGTGRIPSRPFLRTAVEEMDNWSEECKLSVNNVIAGNVTPKRAADLVGQKAVSDIQDSITEIEWTPNAPSTIARKGSSKPLIDQGELYGSIRHKIE